MSPRIATMVVGLAIGSQFGLSQVTVQYDSGGTAVIQDLTPLGLGGNGLAGNYFTGLGVSAAVTQITVYLDSVMGAHGFRLQDALTVTTPALASMLVTSPVSGFNTVNFAPVSFTGTDLFVGFRDYSGFGIALDPVTGGNGSHAFAVSTIGGGATSALTGNFVLRITGPTGLPAELIQFSVQ